MLHKETSKMVGSQDGDLKVVVHKVVAKVPARRGGPLARGRKKAMVAHKGMVQKKMA